MNASQFQDYILGFIFYKYLSDKLVNEVNAVLKPDGITYRDINESTAQGAEDLEHLKEIAVEKLGFFLKPSELFESLATRGNANQTAMLTTGEVLVLNDDQQDSYGENFILEDLERVLKNIERSTLGTESQDDFDSLFYDIDLNSTKIGKSVDERNKVIVKILTALNWFGIIRRSKWQARSFQRWLPQ